MTNPPADDIEGLLEDTDQLVTSARVRRERIDHLGFKHDQLTSAELDRLLEVEERLAISLRTLRAERDALRAELEQAAENLEVAHVNYESLRNEHERNLEDVERLDWANERKLTIQRELNNWVVYAERRHEEDYGNASQDRDLRAAIDLARATAHPSGEGSEE